MLPLVVVFLSTAGVILVLRNFLQQHGFDWQVLSGGNLIIYVITTISMQLLRQGMNATTTQGFMARAYGGIMVKLFACALAACIYIFVARSQVNKPALLTCMALYMVYTFVELKITLKQTNQNKNV